MDAAIRKAEEKLARVSSDKTVLREYRMRELALSDWTSGINRAREEGMEKGMEKGRQEVARNFKRLGMPVEQIARGTGLSPEDIAKL